MARRCFTTFPNSRYGASIISVLSRDISIACRSLERAWDIEMKNYQSIKKSIFVHQNITVVTISNYYRCKFLHNISIAINTFLYRELTYHAKLAKDIILF